jgi:hypothetical protein
MDTFYPPSYKIADEVQAYIDNALDDIYAIRDKAAEDLDRKDYRYFMTLLKEELGE